MTNPALGAVLLCFLFLSTVHTPKVSDASALPQGDARDVRKSAEEFQGERALTVHYLEIVTAEVDATCAVLETLRGVSFGEPIAELGNARTATLDSGGRIGVLAPMRETEEPVVRPYILVDDIEIAVDAAKANGGEIAMPPTEIPGQGEFAIYILGGIQHGLWQR